MVGNYPNDTSELPDSIKTKAVLSTTLASSTQLHHDLDTDSTELLIGISVVRSDVQCDRGVKLISAQLPFPRAFAYLTNVN